VQTLQLQVPLAELSGWGAGKSVMRDGRRWRVQALRQDPERQLLYVTLVDAESLERRVPAPRQPPDDGCPLYSRG